MSTRDNILPHQSDSTINHQFTVRERDQQLTCHVTSRHSVLGLAVEGHVGGNEVTGRKSGNQRNLTSEDASANKAGQLTSVFAWLMGVGALDAEEAEGGRLRSEDRATTNGAYLHGGHGYGDVEVVLRGELHVGHAVGGLDVLSGVLAGGDEHGSDDVGGVGIVTTNRTSNSGTNQVLGNVDLHHGLGGGLEDLLHNAAGKSSLHNDGLATTVDPVYGRGLLVRAYVAGESNDLDVRELGEEEAEGLVGTLADHVHTHAIASDGAELEEQVATHNDGLDLLETGKV